MRGEGRRYKFVPPTSVTSFTAFVASYPTGVAPPYAANHTIISTDASSILVDLFASVSRKQSIATYAFISAATIPAVSMELALSLPGAYAHTVYSHSVFKFDSCVGSNGESSTACG
jgi:hypothetical protein